MNILFIYYSEIISENGGVQRVTSVLTDYFEKNNNLVFFLSCNRSNKNIKTNHRQFFLPVENDIYNVQNIQFYVDFIKRKNIDIVVNQAAQGGGLVSFCNFGKAHKNIKIISVIHNSLLGNVLNFTSSHAKQIDSLKFPFLNSLLTTSFFKKLLFALYILKYKKAYTLMYNSSDKVVLLSKGYFKELKSFVSDCDFTKLSAIPNPCTILRPAVDSNKVNEILYVGRIDVEQKRVDLLLRVWEKIYKKHPNWRLSIVGDGIEKSNLENEANRLGLDRISFYGQQNPIPFYDRAKFLCMTSAYEGFPLVLVEAQNFGTIPIVFNSFASVSDIIKNGENGFLIQSFDLKAFANTLSLIMEDEEKTAVISLNCIEFSKVFSIESIGRQWIDLCQELL
jgi:glycosyltransferase involved in cell wall biosynthesis